MLALLTRLKFAVDVLQGQACAWHGALVRLGLLHSLNSPRMQCLTLLGIPYFRTLAVCGFDPTF